MLPLIELNFTKGHGTKNDFIVIPDFDNLWQPTIHQIKWLCNRRIGIGADGVIRVVSSKHVFTDQPSATAQWFMDYRNSDGSLAEMCGNGARVFARYLYDSGLETVREFVIATRAGLHQVHLNCDQTVSVCMGEARGIEEEPGIMVSLATLDGFDIELLPAAGVLVPNPHAVVNLPPGLVLDAVDLGRTTCGQTDVFPHGVNIEVVQQLGPRHLRMRVLERGAGETFSCGTGACAVAWSAMCAAQESLGSATSGQQWQVDVPGGTLWVSTDECNQLWLRGAADIVARGTVLLPNNFT